MPSNWLIFDRIRAFARQNRLHRFERIYQDQPQADRISSGGDFFDLNNQAAILDQTNLQINRMTKYRDYEMMDQAGEVSLALDLYADEGSLVDPERKHTLTIRARNRRLKRELEQFYFNTLQWDINCRPAIRYLCKFGDLPFEIVLDTNRTSVTALKFMNVYNFTRIETRHGDLIGFFFLDINSTQPQFLHPWQVVHMRLTSFESNTHPYGRSILEGGRKAFQQLRLMEDAALIYRITRAPEKRVFKIPVGMIPPKDVPEYMAMIGRTFKRQRFYNPTTNTFDERYSPLIQEDDFFLPRRPDGSGPEVDTLKGGENVDKIADIEYFKKKVIAPLKIPFSRVGIGEGAGEASEKSLSQSHSEFAKSVQWVQREVAAGLTKAGIVHLALLGYQAEDLGGFDVSLTATSAMEELYRIETWQTRASVMGDLKELGWFPKEWIVTHFTDLSPDEIEELKDMEVEATTGGGGGGGGGGGLDIEEPSLDQNTTSEEDPMAEAAAMTDIYKEEKLPGYDYGAERRVLKELNAAGKHKKVMGIVKKWAQRLGRDQSKSDYEFTSGYDYLLESKELDGLTTTINDGGRRQNVVLVESSIDDNECESVKAEVLAAILEDVVNDDDISDEITISDIPIAVGNL